MSTATTRQDDREALKSLQELQNVGPATAADLLLLGIRSPEDLATRDPDEMFDSLCLLTGERQDPCVWDVFCALVTHAKGGPSLPWWKYTPERKAQWAATRSKEI